MNAGTGTCKTLVYLAPIVIALNGNKKRLNSTDGTHGVIILIATPGPLLDHLKNTGSFKLDNLRWLVIDEAERLLDMGFEKDVQSNCWIRDKLHPIRVPVLVLDNILLAATLNEHGNQLAELSLREPITLVLFLSTCDEVDFHYSLLQEFHFPTGTNIRIPTGGTFLESKMFRLHGNMLQKDRMETFLKFGQESAAV